MSFSKNQSCFACEAHRASYEAAWDNSYPPCFRDGGIYPVFIGHDAFIDRENRFLWHASLTQTLCAACGARQKELSSKPSK
jgi:hypothetical protein